MYARHPGIAKEFEEKTPKGMRLPERVGKRSSQLAAIRRKSKA